MSEQFPPGTILVIDDPVFPWPADEGIWMGWMDDCWFPLKTKELKGDLPGQDDFGKTIAVVAQFPLKEGEWPYLFKGNHPIDKWRKPTDEEMPMVKKFYGI